MNILALVVALAVSYFMGRWSFSFFFEDSRDFQDCLGSAFTADFISLIRGEFWEDIGRSTRISVYFWIIGGAGFATYCAVEEIAKALPQW